MPTTLNMFVPITKVDAVQRLVYGTLASEVVDKSGEVFDYESSKPLVEQWSGEIHKATDGKSVGNLRAMHGKVAAGKFTQLECNDQTKSIEVCAKVIDNDEWEKVAEGVYTGFSIGGSYEKKWTDDAGLKRYTARPSEGSLVDNPANPDAHFTMVKADGASEERHFHKAAEVLPTEPPAPVVEAAPAETPAATPELEQVWKAADGKTFVKKSDAAEHNAKLVAAKADPATALTAAMADLAAKTAALGKRDFTPAAREKDAKSGAAMPGGSYPIVNKSDLENAIKAFGRAKNKKAVKSHIIERAKSLGAEDALPDSWKPGADKSLRFGDLRKDLYAVARLAGLIQELDWLQESTEYEAERENDNSTVPQTLKQSIATICACLRAMVEEETNELLDEDEAVEFGEMLEQSYRTRGIDALTKTVKSAPEWLAKIGMKHGKMDQAHLNAAHDHLAKMGIGACQKDDGGDMGSAAGDTLGKAGARHSKADLETLTKCHDMMKSVGAECPGSGLSSMGMGVSSDKNPSNDGKELTDYGPSPDQPASHQKAAVTGDLAKSLADKDAKIATLEKALTDNVSTVKELAKQVEIILSQPVPHPKHRAPSEYRVVDKSDDVAVSLKDQLEKLTPEDRSMMLVELARASGRPIAR